MNDPRAKERLDAALSKLGKVFGKMRGSRYWTDPLETLEDSSDAESKPVGELTDYQYNHYAWHAVCLNSSRKNCLLAIRYFLPRVAADLAYEGESPWCVPHFAWLLNEYEWREWPVAQVDALEEWIFAWVEYCAYTGEGEFGFDASDCAGICGCDLDKFRLQWQERDSRTSVLWLAHQIERHWESLLNSAWPSRWQNYWWGPASEDFAVRFVGLMLRQRSISTLAEAFFETSDDEQRLLSAAVEHAEYCVRYAHLRPDSPLFRAAQEFHSLAVKPLSNNQGESSSGLAES